MKDALNIIRDVRVIFLFLKDGRYVNIVVGTSSMI